MNINNCRCNLLLMQYPNSISEDEKLLKTEPISTISSSAILMRMCEKKMLTIAISYAKTKSENLKTLTQ